MNAFNCALPHLASFSLVIANHVLLKGMFDVNVTSHFIKPLLLAGHDTPQSKSVVLSNSDKLNLIWYKPLLLEHTAKMEMEVFTQVLRRNKWSYLNDMQILDAEGWVLLFVWRLSEMMQEPFFLDLYHEYVFSENIINDSLFTYSRSYKCHFTNNVWKKFVC